MDTNENGRTSLQEQDGIIMLGVASVETLGTGIPSVELMGDQPIAGISEE